MRQGSRTRGLRCKPLHDAMLLLLLLLVAAALPGDAHSTGTGTGTGAGFSFGYGMVHRFSEKGREMLMPKVGADPRHWPAHNTAEYHRLLFQLDQSRHARGRHLLGEGGYYNFGGDNSTFLFESSLHYAFLDVGTPNVTFFAALDTGSDTTWFPCECTQCASLNDPSIDPSLRPLLGQYSPAKSSTSVNVTCSDNLCQSKSNCTSPADSCPYEVNYLSANTGSFGNLVRDVLYLGNELTPGGPLRTAEFVFGCGRRQTGAFLSGAALDGLVGLGYQDISLPSVLASQGVIANSFSICISDDGLGRIVFGDKGVPGQSSTPILPTTNNVYITYAIQAERITVGPTNIPSQGRDVFYFDTGTSYTILNSNVYQPILNAFNAQVPSSYRRVQGSSLPFELCYTGSPRANPPYFDYPSLNFTWFQGQTIEVADPTVPLVDQNGYLAGFCLGVTNGGNVALFGQNFMTGYKFTFDREENILGWTKTSCYAETLSGGNAPSPISSPTSSPTLSPTSSPTPSPTSSPPSSPTSSPTSSPSPSVAPSDSAPAPPPSGLVPRPPPPQSRQTPPRSGSGSSPPSGASAPKSGSAIGAQPSLLLFLVVGLLLLGSN